MRRKRRWRDRLKEDLKKPGFRRAFQEAREALVLADEISRAREKAGLTQSGLGQAIGTTQSVISRIENGGQNLTLAMLHKIATALHRSVEIHLR